MTEVRFYYDVVCPYAYLASTRIEELAARYGARVSWRPILLGGLFREVQAPQLPAASMSPPRARLNVLDMQRWADRWGVPLSMPAEHPRRTVGAMRLLTGVGEGATRVALTRALFAAYWAEGADVGDPAVLERIAAAHGVDGSLASSEAAREGLRATTAEAAAMGAFGVPAIAVGERFWWGQDRLHFVEAALGGRPRRPGEVDAAGRGGRGGDDRLLPRLLEPLLVPGVDADRAGGGGPRGTGAVAADPARGALSGGGDGGRAAPGDEPGEAALRDA